MAHLWDALDTAYEVLAPLDTAAGGDEVFRQLVLARTTEPTSRQDSLRVLAEVGVEAASYPTLNRRLPGYAAATWRQKLAAACAAHAALGPTSLVMFDVSTPGRRSRHPPVPGRYSPYDPALAQRADRRRKHRPPQLAPPWECAQRAATIACDLLCSLRLFCLNPALAHAEPKTLRYRFLHTAARIVRGQRERQIKIPETWPWADELAAAFHAASH